jgi:Tfp pilus assembly protein PilN
MRAVNLLPEETTSSRLPKGAAIPVAGAAAALVAAGAVGFLAHAESSTIATKQRSLDDLKAQLSRAQANAPSTNSAAAALFSSRDARLSALDAALKSRVPWQTMLRQISAILPADTWVDGLTLNSPVAADPAAAAAAPAATGAAAAPTDVVITGYTSSAASLARVLQRLSVVPSLSDVTLTTSQSIKRGSKDVFQFSISAAVATPGGSS